MDCRKPELEISLYIDGMLSGKELSEFEAHLKGCSKCESLLREMQAITRKMSALPNQPLPAGLNESVERQIMHAGRPLRSPVFGFNNILRGTAVAAAFAILFIFVIDTNRTDRTINPVKSGETAPAVSGKNEKMVTVKEIITIAKPGSKPPIFRGTDETCREKKFIQQWQGSNSGIKDKETLLIENQEELENLWRLHAAGMKPAPEIPKVEFRKCVVVASFTGEKVTAGSKMQITSVKETDNRIYVEIEETTTPSIAEEEKDRANLYHIIVMNRN